MTYAEDAGNLLEKLCKDNSIEAISHRSINTKRHLNTGKLRFNNSGVSIFLRSFRSFLSTFDEIWLLGKYNLAVYTYSLNACICSASWPNNDFWKF